MFKLIKVFELEDMPSDVKDSFFEVINGTRFYAAVPWTYPSDCMDTLKVNEWLLNRGAEKDEEVIIYF